MVRIARVTLLMLGLMCGFNVMTASAQFDTTRSDVVMMGSEDSASLSLIDGIAKWTKDNWIRPGTTKLERIAHVIGASLLFSLFDYIVFHKVVFHPSNEDHSVPFAYRIAQSSVQVGLSYYLYDQMGLSSVAAFNTIWWTWGDDLAFYGWLNLINAAPPWYNRDFHGFQGNGVTWAGWTPVGLVRPQKTIISKDVLITQVLIGFSIAMVIN